MTEVEKAERQARKDKAESMGMDTILKYHDGYIGICKELGISDNRERNATDITMYIINGLKRLYGAKCTTKFDDVIYHYVCKGDMRAVCILVNELLERGVK